MRTSHRALSENRAVPRPLHRVRSPVRFPGQAIHDTPVSNQHRQQATVNFCQPPRARCLGVASRLPWLGEDPGRLFSREMGEGSSLFTLHKLGHRAVFADKSENPIWISRSSHRTLAQRTVSWPGAHPWSFYPLAGNMVKGRKSLTLPDPHVIEHSPSRREAGSFFQGTTCTILDFGSRISD